MSDFFERLDDLLKANHITQTYLADSLKIRRANFSDWRKNGNLPSADIAVKIAQALNTTVEYLVTGKEPAYSLPDDLQAIINKYASS